MVGGFVCKKENRKGLFGKKGYKGGGSLVNRGKGRGFLWQECHLLPPPSTGNRGMEGAGVGGAWPATLGHDSGREEGEKEQGGPWGQSPAAARGEVARGSLATAAGGGGRPWSWWCPCGARQRPEAGENEGGR